MAMPMLIAWKDNVVAPLEQLDQEVVLLLTKFLGTHSEVYRATSPHHLRVGARRLMQRNGAHRRG